MGKEPTVYVVFESYVRQPSVTASSKMAWRAATRLVICNLYSCAVDVRKRIRDLVRRKKFKLAVKAYNENCPFGRIAVLPQKVHDHYDLPKVGSDE